MTEEQVGVEPAADPPEAVKDVRGPMGSSVFVSYRHSDGLVIADRVAALLRAAGIRAWLDRTDMGAAGMDDRIADALAGADAGVLIVTPDLVSSDYVRDREVPALIKRVAEERLPMMVVNTYRDPETGEIDVTKPDEIIDRITDIPLVNITQVGVDTEAGCRQFVYAMLRRRAEEWVKKDIKHLCIRADSTVPGDAVPLADLEVTLEESERKLPTDQSLSAFAIGLPELSRACHRADISSIHVSGRPRLSVALALGSMFPAQRGFEAVTVEGGWGEAGVSDPHLHDVEFTAVADGHGRDAIVLVKLMDNANVKAFERLLSEKPFAKAGRIDFTGEGFLDPGEGTRLARKIADRITALADDADTNRVHLCIIGPFPMAVLIGGALNRLTTITYEYSDDERRYIPLFELRPSAPRSITPLTAQRPEFSQLLNLTPHDVAVIGDDGVVIASWSAAAEWAHLEEHIGDVSVLEVGGRSVSSAAISYGEVLDLPAQREGVGLIVPRVLAERVRRPDLVFPGVEVRDDSGRLVGCRRLDAFNPTL